MACALAHFLNSTALNNTFAGQIWYMLVLLDKELEQEDNQSQRIFQKFSNIMQSDADMGTCI